jgi:hypothetical protein
MVFNLHRAAANGNSVIFVLAGPGASMVNLVSMVQSSWFTVHSFSAVFIQPLTLNLER